jgi:hypothetical protein
MMGFRRDEMNIENEVSLLQAETLAIQTLLAHLLENLGAIGDPLITAAIKDSFDKSASELEIAAGLREKTPEPAHNFVKALGIVENLRTATFGDQKPRR